MNSAIAIFFASLVSGALSLADFKPAAFDIVQILTGVELAPQISPASSGQAKQRESDDKGSPSDTRSCTLRLSLTEANYAKAPFCPKQALPAGKKAYYQAQI